jgi:RNA polymerase sigma-70 factor (ECF subfamily)
LDDDARLIQATLRGDSAAFGRLVRKHQDRLYNALVRQLGSAEDARDVAQEAFAQAFLKLDGFRGNSRFYTWLYRIAFNQAVSHRRRVKPAASLDQSREQNGEEPIDRDSPPEGRLVQQETVEQVRRALAELDPEFRQVLVLREFDDCNYEQIAELLELPIGTVRSRLHRARLQLRDKLKTVLQQEPG